MSKPVQKFVLPFLLVSVGVGIGASMSTTHAQPAGRTSVCVTIDGVNTLRNLNETIRRQESMGYELSTFAGPTNPCFRPR